MVDPLKPYNSSEAILRCPEAEPDKSLSAKSFSPPLPDELVQQNARDQLVYRFQFGMSLATDKGPWERWRIEPQPSSVVAYCHWHLDQPSVGAPSEGEIGHTVQTDGRFQLLHADGSAIAVSARQVKIARLDEPPFEKGYGEAQRRYLAFPGEPEKRALTPLP